MPVNFTARAEDKMKPVSPALKKQMQYAEAVANNIKNKYGCISPSKIMYTFESKRNKEQEEWLKDKQQTLNNLRREYPSSDEKMEFIENILNNSKCFINVYIKELNDKQIKINGVGKV